VKERENPVEACVKLGRGYGGVVKRAGVISKELVKRCDGGRVGVVLVIEDRRDFQHLGPRSRGAVVQDAPSPSSRL
jgi:hypothetical protein